MIQASHIHSLTDFVRNSKSFVDSVESEREPLGLTVNGKLKLVVLDPETYESLYGAQERQRFIAAIREAEADLAAGRSRPYEEVFEEVRKRHGL